MNDGDNSDDSNYQPNQGRSSSARKRRMLKQESEEEEYE